mmetsp:Transcript_49994/g.134519  ORF Transcript_49994/g.134519 Transcript_49994/m.134519 type:complete len:263 (+) Transcript_49994:119-907(+)
MVVSCFQGMNAVGAQHVPLVRVGFWAAQCGEERVCRNSERPRLENVDVEHDNQIPTRVLAHKTLDPIAKSVAQIGHPLEAGPLRRPLVAEHEPLRLVFELGVLLADHPEPVRSGVLGVVLEQEEVVVFEMPRDHHESRVGGNHGARLVSEEASKYDLRVCRQLPPPLDVALDLLPMFLDDAPHGRGEAHARLGEIHDVQVAHRVHLHELDPHLLHGVGWRLRHLPAVGWVLLRGQRHLRRARSQQALQRERPSAQQGHDEFV